MHKCEWWLSKECPTEVRTHSSNQSPHTYPLGYRSGRVRRYLRTQSHSSCKLPATMIVVQHCFGRGILSMSVCLHDLVQSVRWFVANSAITSDCQWLVVQLNNNELRRRGCITKVWLSYFDEFLLRFNWLALCYLVCTDQRKTAFVWFNLIWAVVLLFRGF